MLHVASEAAIHALNRSRQLAAQPPQAAHGAATPFSSLLDDTAATPQPKKQPATDDNVSSARSDQSPQPAKSSDDKTAKTDTADASKDPKQGVKKTGKKSVEKIAKTDNTDKVDQTDQPAKTDQGDKIATDGKIAADDKIVTVAASQDGKPTDAKPTDAKPTDAKPTDAKPTDRLAPVDATLTPPADPGSVIKSPDATVATIAPAVVAAPTSTPRPAAADTESPAPRALAALQADTGKVATDPALNGKTVAVSHDATKPQGPATDAGGDDTAIAHARGEATDHHAAATPALDALTTDTTSAPKASTNVVPPTVLPALSQNTQAATPNPVTAAQQTPQAAAIPLAGVAVEIAGKAASGKNHFEIRLDPPELGRIEVRLAFDHDGNVTSRMIADRADTLDLLRRDASGLERALQDAGLKTAENSLQFSLRDQSAYQQQQQGFTGNDATQLMLDDETLAATDITQHSYGRLAGMGAGLDIQV